MTFATSEAWMARRLSIEEEACIQSGIPPWIDIVECPQCGGRYALMSADGPLLYRCAGETEWEARTGKITRIGNCIP